MTVKIEIQDYATELCVEEHKAGRITSSKWYDVCPSVVKKIVNAKSEPSKADIESWVRDATDGKKNVIDSPCSNNFWDKK